MKKKTLIIFMAMLMGTTLAYADEATKNAQTEKLLKFMKVDQQLEVTNQRMRRQTERMLAAQNLPEGLSGKMQKIFNKQFDMVTEATSWDNLKNDVIAIYTTTFTEEEINGLVEFYSSDLGQKMIANLPDLFQKGMEIAQNRLMEKKQEIEKTMMEEWVQFEAELTDEERAVLESIQRPGNGL